MKSAWTMLGLTLLVLAGLGMPVGVLLDWLIRGLRSGEPFAHTWGAAWHSLSVSATAGAVAVVAALPVAIVAVRRRGWPAMLTERLSFIGYALPGIVVALALVFFSLKAVPALYQTWIMLIFAYVVLFLPQAVGSIRTALAQVRPSMEEAARGLGHRSGWVTLTITVPLVLPGLLGGFALVFLTTMKELPATLLLAPIGFDTLAGRVWSASSEAFFARAAAPALLLIVLAAVPMAILVGREQLAEDA